jgi:hypothetical protein
MKAITIRIGDRFLLKTRDMNGGLLPREQWIEATWAGRGLMDKDGCTWTEWLDDDDDIVMVTEH